MKWNAEEYHRFKDLGYLPFEDLCNEIDVKQGMKVIDLGCGTGELTRRLADRLNESNVLGIDSSFDMLLKANEYSRDGLEFKHSSIEDIVEGEEKWDLVFTQAAIQWVDNHYEFIPKLASIVKEGGQLAVQMPSNDSLYTHVAAVNIAKQKPFCDVLEGWLRKCNVLPIDEYSEILIDNGAKNITVFEKVYPQVFNDCNQMTKWFSNTMLLPYLQRMPADISKAFLDEYRSSLAKHWTEEPIIYPFRRTIFVATF